MKLEYKGAYRDHGMHTIHSSGEMKRPAKGEWVATNKSSVVASSSSDGVNLRFDGTGNLSANANYELRLSVSDQEIIELFEMRFGLEMTVLDVKKELFGEFIKQRGAAGLPSPRIPLLVSPAS